VIDVVNDAQGVRIALEEIFEEDYARSRISSSLDGAKEETRIRMLAQVPPRTLSPGYYSFAEHLLRLEAQKEIGVTFAPERLARYEVSGLVELRAARMAFKAKHPECSTCGARQQNRFGAECHCCGVKFQRKGA
jgi:hypothetical protein